MLKGIMCTGKVRETKVWEEIVSEKCAREKKKFRKRCIKEMTQAVVVREEKGII